MPRPVSRPAGPAGRVRRVTLVAGGLAVLVAAAQGWGRPAWWLLPALVAVVVAAETAALRVQPGRQRWTSSLTEAALAAGWVAATGAWSVLAVVAGVCAVQVVRRQPSRKVGYHLAQLAAATALGSAAAQLCGGEVAGAGVGMLVFFLVTHGLTGVAVSITSRRPLGPLLRSSAPLSALHTAGGTSLGLLAAYLATAAPLGLLGLLVPLALLWASYDQQSRRNAEARLLDELAHGQELATGRSTDVSAQVVVTAAARLLGGADVEMVLLTADGPVRFAGSETGVPERRRVAPDAFATPWVVQALTGGVRIGVQDGRPWVSAALGEPGRPLAVLLARRPPGSAGFGRAEVRLAQVLVRQAETWLSLSELAERSRAAEAQAVAVEQATDASARALGDLGAATAPSLRMLHESAERLARLAEQAGEIDDIVDELHLVERAVASLLGAIALAADPDLRSTAARADRVGPAGRPGPARPATDWTTTGVLR